MQAAVSTVERGSRPALRRLELLANHAGPRSLCPVPAPAPSVAAAAFCDAVITQSQRRTFDEQGFVKISGLVPEDMVQRLLTATESLTELARSLAPDDTTSPLSNTIRTVGARMARNSLPTARGADGAGVDFKRHNPEGYLHTLGQPWSVSGILHPDLPESATFLEYYGSPSVHKLSICRCL